ncbi:HIRAN domain-containing protein [Curtobacterium flaccumfaciens]|uniref:HIRAN domain-containing protein n=1 Tax=Curtobacterium flaccumfaciens TaxID=2035 RepID=UPI0021CA9F50|nr:HIRAN domain-containing protein [Curtobacterium flaccumfaciens]UXN21421.1 HIRAN domain-containing protein [Curtobacterium flaccumfaciens pv. flaccumfaciens]
MGLLIVLAMMLMIAAVLIVHRIQSSPRRPSLKRTPSSTDYRFSTDSALAKEDLPGDEATAHMAARAADQDEPRSASNGLRVSEVYLDQQLPTIDLRSLPASRFRIVGTMYWLRDDERARYGGQRYVLVREPENVHDLNAVAVFGKGRKIGHLSAAKAAALAGELDRLGPAEFVVRGATVSPESSRLWIDIPRVSALRSRSPLSKPAIPLGPETAMCRRRNPPPGSVRLRCSGASSEPGL